MLYRLLQELRGRADHEHAIVTLTDNCGFDFAALGVPVTLIELRKAPLRGLAALRRFMLRYRPHVVQAWMYHGNLAATLAAPAGIPIAWGIHHSLHDLANEKFATRAVIGAGARLSHWRRTRRIVFVSERSRVHHTSHGYAEGKSVVIPNGFDCTAFSPDPDSRRDCRAELGIDEGALLIGNFGRYHPVKEHGLLLRSFAAVTDRFPEARLVLAGSGVTRENTELSTVVDSLGLRSRVLLLGARGDMPRLYNALDFYVLSSRTESFPNVLGEASACGVPSVTTDVGDAAQIVGNTGLIVPPLNSEALSSALSELLALSRSQRFALGARARTHVIAHFALPAVAEAYAKLYDELARLDA